MKDKQKQEKFIELRAKGLSFNKIAEEIDVSKPTLIKWSRDLYKEIANFEYLETQSLIEQYKISRSKKIETLTKKLSEIYSILEEYDIKSLSLKELIALKDNLENQLTTEKKSINYFTGETESSFMFDIDKDIEITIPLD
jgi:transposase